MHSQLLLQASPVTANEGELSVQKARTVRNVELAEKAQQSQYLQLQKHLLLLPYQAADYMPTGSYPGCVNNSNTSTGCSGDSSSAMQAPVGLLAQPLSREAKGKRLADCVEALIGAVYLTAAAEAAAAAANGQGQLAAPVAAAGLLSGGTPVSTEGLAAAASFCAAVGILPSGRLLLSHLFICLQTM